MNAAGRHSRRSTSPGRSLAVYGKWATVLLTLTGFSFEQASQMIAGLMIMLSSVGTVLLHSRRRWEAFRHAGSKPRPATRPVDDAPRISHASPGWRSFAAGRHIPFSNEVPTP